jgi:hypothetical protein
LFINGKIFYADGVRHSQNYLSIREPGNTLAALSSTTSVLVVGAGLQLSVGMTAD